MDGIMEINAVSLHGKKYATIQMSQVPRAINKAGKTVKLLLIFGWAISDM